MKDFKLNRNTRPELIASIESMVFDGKDYSVTIQEQSKVRGLSANAQQHVWYGQIAKHYDDSSPLDIKNMCKDLFGIPIMLKCAENKDKMAYLLDKLSYYRHGYENRMKLIQCLSITSEFKTKQSKEYMDTMIHYFNGNGITINYRD